MRYQLSGFLRDADQEAAVGMKIGMLANASPEKQEVLVKEIADLGNLWHLEGLQGLDSLSGRRQFRLRPRCRAAGEAHKHPGQKRDLKYRVPAHCTTNLPAQPRPTRLSRLYSYPAGLQKLLRASTPLYYRRKRRSGVQKLIVHIFDNDFI